MEEERFRFIEEYRSGELSFAELCRWFGVSRKTGYKWVGRYEAKGWEGLADLSRAPHRHAGEVLDEVKETVLEARRGHPTWGPIKLKAWLGKEAPEVA